MKDILDQTRQEIQPPAEIKPPALPDKIVGGVNINDIKIMTPEDIDRFIQINGAGIAYAGLIELALAHDTPSGVKYNVCAAIAARAEVLNKESFEEKDVEKRLKKLPTHELLNLIEAAESRARESGIVDLESD